MAINPADAVARCQTILAHAWMVRTFVKHSPEVEDFPELMEIARTVFDISRALETRVDDPAGYRHLLVKKLGKLKKAANAFRQDAPMASSHTNFQQAVLSMDGCLLELEAILQDWPAAAPVSTASPPLLPADGAVSIEPGDWEDALGE
jgi:hypothetical protein